MTAGIKATAELRGADRFASTIRTAAERMGDLRDADTRAGAIVTARARSYAPRVSGALAATIRAETGRNTVHVLAGWATVVYAGVIHNGWPAHNIEPQPFITRAVEDTEAEVVDGYAANVQSLLDKVEGA